MISTRMVNSRMTYVTSVAIAGREESGRPFIESAAVLDAPPTKSKSMLLGRKNDPTNLAQSLHAYGILEQLHIL